MAHAARDMIETKEEKAMKLATKTNDFSAHTSSQIEALQYLREAGFRYADYSFDMDYKHRSGVYCTD